MFSLLITNQVLCTDHNEIFKFICFACNKLFCSQCVTAHTRHYPLHSFQFEHVSDLKLNLTSSKSSFKIDRDINNNNNDNNNNNNNNKNNNIINIENQYSSSSVIQNKIIQLWDQLKILSTLDHSSNLVYTKIHNFFESLHQALILEEQRLKRNLNHVTDPIEPKVEMLLKELVQLINILNINNYKQPQPLQLSLSEDSQDSEGSEDSDEYYSFADDVSNNLVDQTKCFQTQEIMKSIVDSENFQSFYQSNIFTIFNHKDHPNNNVFNIRRPQYNSNDDLKLDLLVQHNSIFKSTEDSFNSNVILDLEVGIYDFSILKKSIGKSIQLNIINNENNNQTSSEPSYTYLFSPHKNKTATIFNLSLGTSEEVPIFDCLYMTFSACLTIGEYIYIFGGYTINFFFRFSIRTKKIEKADMKGIRGGFGTSICYDGLQYIYILEGQNPDQTSRIDRYDILNNEFERFGVLKNHIFHVLSIYYKEMIYTFPSNKNVMIRFCPHTKSIEDSKSGCTDGNGNAYILAQDGSFIRYNIEFKQFNRLQSMPRNEHVYTSMVFHKVSDYEHNIYYMGGTIHKNYKYSIEENEWTKIFKGDHSTTTGNSISTTGGEINNDNTFTITGGITGNDVSTTGSIGTSLRYNF
ncbi:hypothetical protein PPL_04689 [Heterostelium album PN500]|uniref:B box-type domain-containing protein n=1 Tax=Heterostelium pallidum (strain ATCC 26659 / Pp 5 / PN500) TaxID=670386 RepID=D3B898_HETP5|nr:hypothetical protein PPL_04689 [Heterostelium album PN500]EFA82266.1 hypothetical protein PPL_04689 [Heterostelium album PN500]|eukprot:XP_020434383.1 hypothetical protein PPL_04689 [Heterostelium album PN500]